MKNIKMMVVGFASAVAVTVALSTTLLAKSDAPAVSEASVEASRLQSLAKFTKVLGIVEHTMLTDLPLTN